jgi:hypothetical protein
MLVPFTEFTPQLFSLTFFFPDIKHLRKCAFIHPQRHRTPHTFEDIKCVAKHNIDTLEVFLVCDQRVGGALSQLEYVDDTGTSGGYDARSTAPPSRR